jgi:hypothetical protein
MQSVGKDFQKKIRQPRNRATAQPRRVEGRIIFTADAISRTAKSSHRTAGIFPCTPARSNRPVGLSSRTADSFAGTAGSASRTVGSTRLMADTFIPTAGSFNRMAGGLSRTTEPSSRTNNSSSRMVLRQKHAKTGKNRPFSPSRHARWPKSDSLPACAGRARHSVRAACARTLANDGSLATLAVGRGLPSRPLRVFHEFRGSTHN